MNIMDLLAGILNPNPGQNRLANPNANGPNYLTQTGLGPEQLARFHQQSGLGGGGMPSAPQAAQPTGDAWAGMREAGPMLNQQQTASVGAPVAERGGMMDGLRNLFGGGGERQAVQWLTEQGVDPGVATMMAKHKPALQAYLLERAQGRKPIEVNGRLVDPNSYEVLADFSTPGNRQTATIDGKLVDTNTGAVIGDYGADGQTRTMAPEEVAAAGLAPGVYQQDKEGKISAVGSVRDQDAGFKNEMELRKEYDMLPEVKDYKVVRSNYERIRQGVPLGTGAGDAAIVFGYMKMLDPTSVVREGEQATTRNAAGVPEAVRGMYNQLVGGGQLSGEARQQILGAAEKVYGESVGNIEDVNKRYGGYAGAWKLDPSRIVAPTEQYDPLAPVPGAPPPPMGPAAVAPQGPTAPPAPGISDRAAREQPPADVTDWRDWLAPGRGR